MQLIDYKCYFHTASGNKHFASGILDALAKFQKHHIIYNSGNKIGFLAKTPFQRQTIATIVEIKLAYQPEVEQTGRCQSTIVEIKLAYQPRVNSPIYILQSTIVEIKIVYQPRLALSASSLEIYNSRN